MDCDFVLDPIRAGNCGLKDFFLNPIRAGPKDCDFFLNPIGVGRHGSDPDLD